MHASFNGAATPAARRRLAAKSAVAVVLLAPSPAWVGALQSYFEKRLDKRWHVIARDGTGRLEHKASAGNADVALALNAGRPVLGIAPAVDVLPATLITAADINLRVAAPDSKILRNAIDAVFGRSVAVRIPSRVGAGLDLPDLVAAFRPRSSPQQIVDRITRAAARQLGSDHDFTLPSLETAVEYGEARQWALALAEDMSAYRAGQIKWSDVSRGVILHGESGTGKSLFARMVAAHVGLPLIAFSIADLFADNAGDLGAVVNATNAMFSRAAAAAPCIAFLDELDALPNRAALSKRGRDWWLPVCSNFLVKLDGVGALRSGIIFCGATNFIDRIDSALRRPGRLERAIEIGRPNLEGTINILRHYAPNLPAEDSSQLGRQLAGSTGAELMIICRDARRIARRNGRDLQAEDIRAAALPSECMPPQKLRRVCIHEAAHAVATLVLSAGQLRGIVVNNQHGTAARTMLEQEEEPDLPTRTSVEARTVVLLCGRVAEQIFFDEASVGSGTDEDSDLGHATRLIAALHASAGLGDSIVFTSDHHGALNAVREDKGLRRRVDRHLRGLQKHARRIVLRHREAISRIAEALAATRYLSREAVENMLHDQPTWPRAR